MTVDNSTLSESLQLISALRALAERNGIQYFTDPGWLPPAYTESNYVAPDLGPVLFICNLLFMAITFLVVLVRFYTRVGIAGGLGGDDYMIGISTLILIGSTALNSYGVKEGGFGKHFYDLDVKQVTKMLKALYMLPTVYSLGVVAIKVSILLFYRRLFGANRRMQRVVMGLIIFQVAFALASCLTFILICHPVRAWWILADHADYCPTFKQTNARYVGLRVVTVVCDIIVVILPMRMVSKLEIPLRQRLALSILFGLGILACGLAIARLCILPRLLLHLDVSWNVLPIALLDQGEQCIGIITASIPALTALMSRGGGRIKSSGSIELNRSGEGSPGVGKFDYLRFAYDPDRQNCYSTAYAYGGSTKNDPRIREQNGSDVNLVDPSRINKTTTVTVAIQ